MRYIPENTSQGKNSVYQQLREVPEGVCTSSGKFHLGKVPIGGNASWGTSTCRISWVYRQLGNFTWRKGQLGELPLWGTATWGNFQLGDFNLSDFLGAIFILIHFYLMNPTNEHFFLN